MSEARAATARLALTLALGWWGWVIGQPYAADGGFTRPERLFAEDPRPLVALALDRGAATVVRRHAEGLQALALDSASGRPLSAATGVRELRASGSLAAPLDVLYTIRDPVSGNFQHRTLDGVQIYQTANPAPLLWLSTDTGPWLLSLRVRGGVSEIVRVRGGAPVEVLHRSELQLQALSGDWRDGQLHLTWLEGFLELGVFGLISDWTAYAASLADGDNTLAPQALAPAAGVAERTITSAGPSRVVRAFQGPDGVVMRALATSADVRLQTLEATVAGRPIGAWADEAHAPVWISRFDSILRWRSPEDLVAVAWSPMVVLDGWVVRDAAGVTQLLWIGTDVGGDGLVYRADDSQPMVRRASDRIAAVFNWRPWSWGEEAAGQLLTALLVAVLIASAAVPLLWPLGFVLAGIRAPLASLRGAAVGASLPALTALLATLAGIAPATLMPLLGGIETLLLAGFSAFGGAWGLWRRRDIEALPAFVLSAATALALAAGLSFFFGFRAWLALGWW